MHGDLHPLVSERDQNFRVTAGDGRRYVFKIANRAESELCTDLQVQALLHIEARQCEIATPRIIRGLDGRTTSRIGDEPDASLCRVVSYLAGRPLGSTTATPALATNLGRSAAALDGCLADFEHPGASHPLLWDLQRAGELRELLVYVDEPELRRALHVCLDDFDRNVQPELPHLRRQVIHGDLNPANILVGDGEPDEVAGIIDFGDMLRAPLIMEVAIAAAYLRVTDFDTPALSLLMPLIDGFNSVLPLSAVELELLFDLIRARLAASLSICCWRLGMRGAEDAYTNKSLATESGAATFLQRLDSLGREEFTRLVKMQR